MGKFSDFYLLAFSGSFFLSVLSFAQQQTSSNVQNTKAHASVTGAGVSGDGRRGPIAQEDKASMQRPSPLMLEDADYEMLVSCAFETSNIILQASQLGLNVTRGKPKISWGVSTSIDRENEMNSLGEALKRACRNSTSGDTPLEFSNGTSRDAIMGLSLSTFIGCKLVDTYSPDSNTPGKMLKVSYEAVQKYCPDFDQKTAKRKSEITQIQEFAKTEQGNERRENEKWDKIFREGDEIEAKARREYEEWRRQFERDDEPRRLAHEKKMAAFKAEHDKHRDRIEKINERMREHEAVHARRPGETDMEWLERSVTHSVATVRRDALEDGSPEAHERLREFNREVEPVERHYYGVVKPMQEAIKIRRTEVEEESRGNLDDVNKWLERWEDEGRKLAEERRSRRRMSGSGGGWPDRAHNWLKPGFGHVPSAHNSAWGGNDWYRLNWGDVETVIIDGGYPRKIDFSTGQPSVTGR